MNGPDTRLASITATCTLLLVMVTLDTTVVNVAQRSFVTEFATTPAVAGWTLTGYTLALAAVIPFTGWAANRFGTRRLALAAVLLFTVGSLLCALAPNMLALVVFRAVQGLGGGMLMPLQLIIVSRAAGPQLLGRVLTVCMVPVLIAPVCGPVLGGWLIDSFGWQWIFLINIPFGLLTMTLAAAVLPRDDPPGSAPLDLVGMLLLSPGLVALLYGVSLLPERPTITDPQIWVPTATGLAMVGAFVWHAVRSPGRPLIDLRLLRSRDVAAANAIRFLFVTGFFGSLLLFPAYFQQVLGASPLASGLLLLPQTAGAAAVLPLVGRMLDKRGPRGVVLVGTALVVAGMAVFVHGSTDRQVDLVVLLTGLALFGVGSGCLMTPVSWAAVHSLDAAELTHGSTLFNVLHNTAASVGAALTSVLLTVRIGAGAAATAAELAHAYAGVFIVAMIVLGAAAVPALFLPARHPAR